MQPIDLLKIAQADQKAKLMSRDVEANLIIFGDKGAGKTSYINMLKNSEDKMTKASSGVEYRFIRKQNIDRKELVNVYELGGGRMLSDLMTLPFEKEKFERSSLVLVLNLAQPQDILQNLLFWIDQIQRKLESYLDINNMLAEQQYLTKEYQETMEDSKKLSLVLGNVIILGNQYDKFIEFEPESRKWVTRALRLVAHKYGCHLFFNSNQQEQLSSQNRGIINQLLFQEEKMYFQSDHQQPIFISRGQDSFGKIGLPPNIVNYKDQLTWLQKQLDDNFQQKAQQKEITNFYSQITKFPENQIDQVKIEKHKNLSKENESIINQFNLSPQKQY